jgi:hypothetical protein
MSETTVTETETTTDTLTAPTTGNPAVDALAQVVWNLANELNNDARAAQSAMGDNAKKIKEVRESSEDPRIVKFREYEEKTLKALSDAREKVNALITSEPQAFGVGSGEVWTDEVAAEKKKAFGEKRKAFRGALDTFKSMAQIMGVEVPGEPTILNFSGKEAASGSTGGKRPRFDSVTVNGVEVKTLSGASQKIYSETKIRVSASELLAALQKDTGVDDVTTLNDASIKWSETVDGVTHSFDIAVVKAQGEDASDSE